MTTTPQALRRDLDPARTTVRLEPLAPVGSGEDPASLHRLPPPLPPPPLLPAAQLLERTLASTRALNLQLEAVGLRVGPMAGATHAERVRRALHRLGLRPIRILGEDPGGARFAELVIEAARVRATVDQAVEAIGFELDLVRRV